MKTTIDGAGRIVIPKRIREQAGLYAGLPIEIRLDGDEIVLTTERPAQRLVRQGRYVSIVREDPEAVLTDGVVQEVRDELWRERAVEAGVVNTP